MQIVKLVMGSILFLLGLFTAISGLYIILRKEYQEAVKTLTSQSPKLVSKAAVEEIAVPVLNSSAQLLDTLNKLVQTATGAGAFLALLGSSLCVVGYWMISN
jgi:hypothetical protein